MTSNAITVGAEGGTVDIDGGIRIVGAATSVAYKADTTTLRLLAGASVDKLKVEGARSNGMQLEGVLPKLKSCLTLEFADVQPLTNVVGSFVEPPLIAF